MKPYLALGAMCAAALVSFVFLVAAGHSAPSHNSYWNQGYAYGRAHAALASSSPQPLSQWCAIQAYTDSGYTRLKQEGDWAHGCEAALS